MPDIKNYIIANNVKNPFQMRATSPLAVNTPTTDLVMVDAPATPSYVPPESSDSGVRPSAFGAFGELTIDPLAEKSDKQKEKDKLNEDLKEANKTFGRKGPKLTIENTESLRFPNIMDISNKRMPTRGSAAAYRDPDSPLNYSTPNPFTPREQGIIGNIYNPSGSDISRFQANQRITKDPTNIRLGDAQMDPTIIDPNPNTIDLNPNTYNQPAIPTEAQTTMNDLQMENEPMGAFGDDLTGAMNNNVGLPPEQGMGSTRGFVPQLSRKERRQQRRSDRRDARREQGTGLRNFITRAVTGGMLGYNGPGNEDRQYRRTGTRPFGG